MIIALTATHTDLIAQVAAMLTQNFAPQAWATLDESLAEVYDSFAADHISRVALDASGAAVGWVGAQPMYNQHTWEMHPLVVRADRHRQGIGQALVADIEAQVRARGCVTMVVASDDQQGRTNLFGVDLYPNVLERLLSLTSSNHPFRFYQKCGYVVVGVIPDASGMGQPDIWLAKRLI